VLSLLSFLLIAMHLLIYCLFIIIAFCIVITFYYYSNFIINSSLLLASFSIIYCMSSSVKSHCIIISVPHNLANSLY